MGLPTVPPKHHDVVHEPGRWRPPLQRLLLRPLWPLESVGENVRVVIQLILQLTRRWTNLKHQDAKQVCLYHTFSNCSWNTWISISAKLSTLLKYSQFAPSNVGDRVLSCGEGESLGHPGRTTTKKPRKVDVFEEENLRPVQVVAGGVHSAVLTDDGQVFMCGINEKGTVPAEGVESEGSTDMFTPVPFSETIKKEGKVWFI